MKRKRHVDAAEYQGDLYDEVPAEDAGEPIETAQLSSVAMDSAPPSSPLNAEGRPEVQSELTAADDAHQNRPERQQEIAEPQQAPYLVGRNISANRTDIVRRATTEWMQIQLGLVDIHPSLPMIYQKLGIAFPPKPPRRYLTPQGILSCANHLPMHVIAEGSRFLCFAGFRLYLSALNSIDPGAWVGAFVYNAVTDEEMEAAIEINERILPLWLRETRAERKSNEDRHLDGVDPQGFTYQDQDQDQLSEVFGTCRRTVQAMIAARRKTQ